jgi:diketogulonate reductase-like aldo/keto reductase
LIPLDPSDRKPIGRTGETVSAVGLGTWAIRDYRGAFEAYLEAFRLGLDNIDTAEMYDNGGAERFVGELVKVTGRTGIFITTKLLPQRFRSRESTIKAARLSLERLGVKEADLILIHWPDDIASIEEQVRNLEATAEEGLTRYIGVSNFTLEELEVARSSLRKHDIVVNQVKYSVLDRAVEEKMLPYAIREGITIQAYTPLERGAVLKASRLKEIASKYGKTPVQVALNYLISRPRVIAIPKAEKVEHVREIVGALGWRLREEDIEVLSKL